MESLADRNPPMNLDAERGVLGAILHNPRVLSDVLPLVSAEDFWLDPHQIVYRTIREMDEHGKPIEPIALLDELDRRGDAARVGGYDAISEIMLAVPHAANACYHAGIVREKATTRRVIEAGADMIRRGYSDLHTADELIEHSEAQIFAIGQYRTGSEPVPMPDLADQAMVAVAARSEGIFQGIATRFTDLDNTLCGLRPGQVVVLAARPAMGKSALALNIAENAVLGLRLPTLFVSLEMGGVQLAERTLSSQGRVDGHKLRLGEIGDQRDQASLIDACRRLHDAGRFWVDSSPGQSVHQIAATARRFRSRHQIELLVIDYLQLVEVDSGGKFESRQQQVGKVSRRLKRLARELQIPILLLSQLNRNAETREDHRPRMSDLRESGDIEQDADVVLLLHRPDYYDPADQPGVAEVIVAKNRDGQTGTVKLTFLKHISRFENHAERLDSFGPMPDSDDFREAS